MKSRIRPPWPSALSAITRPWWQLLGPSLLVMSLASGANMIAGIGLARLLDPTDLGKYMLLISLAGILGLVGSRGQPGLTKRIYALSPPGTYDWLHDTGHGVLFALPTLIGALVAVIVLYRLTMSAALTLMALLSLSLLTLFVVQVLLSARCYARGNLLIRLPNALMTLPVLLLSFGEQTIIYTSVVGYRLLAALIVLGLGIHWMRSATCKFR